MKETQLCTVIKKSICNIPDSWAYKIPDPSNNYDSTIQRPFDLFGTIKDKPIYIEAKLIKGLKAFNFKSIREHQIDNLMKIKKCNPDSLCLIALGVYIPRKSFVLFFDIEEIYELIMSGKKSLLKKDIEKLLDNDKHYPIAKGLIDVKF